MKTLAEINAEAKRFAPDNEAMQDAFVQGARYALTGRYYKEANMYPDLAKLGQSTVSHVEEDPSFEDWWNAYNKKRGRKKAEAKWNKLSHADKIACMKATPIYVAYIEDKQFQKDPCTYLNGECWNDEIIPKTQNNEQQRNIQRAQRAARLVASAYRQG